MHALFRFKTAIALMTLCLLMGASMTARVAAQDNPTAASPIVGVWTMPPSGEETGSVVALSSDGIVVDKETDGASAVGAWEATGPDTGVMTFVFFYNEEEFTGSVIVRAALTYDPASDTLAASYTVTGATLDGTVVFSDETPTDVTLTRFPPQGPEHVGEPIEGLIGAPEATPAA